jgi:hypothetical protein
MQNISVVMFGRSRLNEECDFSSGINLMCGDDGQNVSFCVRFKDSITGCPSNTTTVIRMGEYVGRLRGASTFMCSKLQWKYRSLSVLQQQ